MTAFTQCGLFIANNEGIVTLVFVAIVGLAFWIRSMICSGACKLDAFAFLLLSAVGIVTGIYIFGGALKHATGSSQDIIWGGITGFILTLYSVEQAYKCFRQIGPRPSEPRPEKTDS